MNTDLKPVMDGVFEAGPSPHLIGAICPECQQKFFPKPMVCPQCLGEVEDIKLSPEGKLYTYAILRTKAMYKLPQPYAVGWVDLEADGLRIFSLLDPEKIEDLDFGKPVSLRVGPIGVDNNGEACLRYYFTTQDGGDK